MTAPAVVVRGVTKKYGEQSILSNIHLSVARGEFLAIEGRSGSGKSTLLNIIGGLDRDFTGNVSVEGEDVPTKSDADLATFRNRAVGFIFQSFNLLSGLTALENVLLPSFFAKAADNDAKARAVQALTTIGLADKVAQKPGQLSGGERQRVAIARALFLRPPLLLCDEPTGNLDATTGAEIIDLFGRLARETGVTLIVVTHELRVARVAQRRLLLRAGQLVQDTNSEGAA